MKVQLQLAREENEPMPFIPRHPSVWREHSWAEKAWDLLQDYIENGFEEQELQKTISRRRVAVVKQYR